MNPTPESRIAEKEHAHLKRFNIKLSPYLNLCQYIRIYHDSLPFKIKTFL